VAAALDGDAGALAIGNWRTASFVPGYSSCVLMVLRYRLIDSSSRSRGLRTFAYIDKVRTSSPPQAWSPARQGGNNPVNFQHAAPTFSSRYAARLYKRIYAVAA
jgi:hypothetical protein